MSLFLRLRVGLTYQFFKLRKGSLILSLFCLIACSPSTKNKEKESKKTLEVSFKVLAQDLTVPWEILWGNDQVLWMTNHHPNAIVRLDPKTILLEKYTVEDTALNAKEELIIMGLEQHPNFPQEPFFYVSYGYIQTKKPGTLVLTCKKYRVDQENKELVDPQTFVDGIVVENSMLPGGRLKINRDSLLFIATSDETGHNFQSRDMNSLSGKFLCYDLNGRAIGATENMQGPIYASGVRNAQGIAETSTGELFFCDHGPSSDDEVNLLIPNGDYGWPDVLGKCDTEEEQFFCKEKNIVEPLIAWTPTIAPSSLSFYDHDLYPDLKNSLLLTTLKESDVRILKLNENRDKIINETILFDNEFGRIRDIVVSNDGRIFITTANNLPESFTYALPESKQDFSYDVVVELIFPKEKTE